MNFVSFGSLNTLRQNLSTLGVVPFMSHTQAQASSFQGTKFLGRQRFYSNIYLENYFEVYELVGVLGTVETRRNRVESKFDTKIWGIKFSSVNSLQLSEQLDSLLKEPILATSESYSTKTKMFSYQEIQQSNQNKFLFLKPFLFEGKDQRVIAIN